MNFNVDLKSLRKIIEECMKNIKVHQERHLKTDKDFNEINTNLVRTLKNSDTDKEVLSREIFRMQHIDRLKVAHAKDSFYNPDVGSLLPSLDTAHASGSVNAFMSQSQSMYGSPQPGLGESPGARDYYSMISQNDIITKNEIKGICERHGVSPSQRQRIIIARSQDPVNYSLNSGITTGK
jgi:hypothetical protein